eukprot:m.794028 g.794028  ORF g.794028 m.794028 type:complete len:161 (-) comp59236_c0_seq3:1679-2161(-)
MASRRITRGVEAFRGQGGDLRMGFQVRRSQEACQRRTFRLDLASRPIHLASSNKFCLPSSNSKATQSTHAKRIASNSERDPNQIARTHPSAHFRPLESRPGLGATGGTAPTFSYMGAPCADRPLGVRAGAVVVVVADAAAPGLAERIGTAAVTWTLARFS